MTIGDYSFISTGVLFDAAAPIRIGAGVSVGPRASFLTSTRDLARAADDACDVGVASAPIVVGDGCWIGASATILGGVTVGRGCVIAARAVVTTDCEPDGLYAGVPAVRKRDLS